MDKQLIENTLLEYGTPCKVYTYEQLPSTNTTAKDIARCGEAEFTLVCADKQSEGRGRLGRSFYSPEDSGLYLSLIVRPKFTFDDAFLITPCTAVAVADVLKEKYNKNPQIKWVNDIYINSRKVCGILTESSFAKDGFTEWAVIGIGINLTAPKNGFPDEISSIASGVFTTSEQNPAREQITAQIISSVIRLYKMLPDTSFIEAYKEMSFLKQKMVFLQSGESVKVLGISDRCGLIIQHSDGKVETLTSSDVSVKIADSSV